LYCLLILDQKQQAF